jgi:alpha-N-acetylglucosamine transferase
MRGSTKLCAHRKVAFCIFPDSIKASEARLEKLVESYLDGDIPKELYVKKKDEVMRATLTLREKLKDTKRSGNNWVEPLREWILDTKRVNFLANSDDLQKQKEFVQKIGTNPFVRDKSARFGVPVLSEMVRAYNAKSDFGHPLLPSAKVVRIA